MSREQMIAVVDRALRERTNGKYASDYTASVAVDALIAAGCVPPDELTDATLAAERIIRRALDAADASTPPDTIAENAAYALKTHGVLAAPVTLA